MPEKHSVGGSTQSPPTRPGERLVRAVISYYHTAQCYGFVRCPVGGRDILLLRRNINISFNELLNLTGYEIDYFPSHVVQNPQDKSAKMFVWAKLVIPSGMNVERKKAALRKMLERSSRNGNSY